MNLRQMGVLAAIAVILDQIVKWLVETRLSYEVLVDVLPFLGLFRTWNQGVAFSLLWGLNDLALVALTFIIILFVTWLASQTSPANRLARLGFALIIGGAIGNLIDRAIYGHVVDYVLFHTPVWSFAVFNLADAFISVGAGAVILAEFVEWRHARQVSQKRD